MLKLVVTTLIFFTFNSHASDSTHMKNMKKEKSSMTMSSKKEIDAKTKTGILAILEANESLHAAFFKYDGKKVERNAKAVSKKIAALKNEEIKKLLTYGQKTLSKITAKADREENNKNYHLVSMALIHVINTYQLGDKYAAYRCPMVRKKWVQNTKKMAKVHNPYAPEMPHCGSLAH